MKTLRVLRFRRQLFCSRHFWAQEARWVWSIELLARNLLFGSCVADLGARGQTVEEEEEEEETKKKPKT